MSTLPLVTTPLTATPLPFLPFVSGLGILAILYLVFTILRYGSREKNLPPGPPTIPVLGNAHLVAATGGDQLHEKFVKWGNQYGSVFSLKIGRGTMVVLNSKRAVHDLVDKRSAIYSARPFDNQMVEALHGESFAMMHPDNNWKAQRKVTVQFLTPTRLDGEIAKIFEAELTVLLHDLLTTPENFKRHIKGRVASAAAIAIFGQRARSTDDFWATNVYIGLDAISKALAPGSYLPTEHFPFLKIIPSSWLRGKERARDAYRVLTTNAIEAVEKVEQRRSSGDKRISLLDKILDGTITNDNIPTKKSAFANFMGTIWGGSADTTTTATLTNLKYLANHPHFQEKARVELDKICGVERMPTFEDFKEAPYVNCIVKEGLRINAVVKIGVPHRVTRDDWYEGMLIPKDATVIIPAHSLGRTQYENSDAYNPDRYLGHPRMAMDYAGSGDYENRDHYAYGAGRRICAGINLAERTQWRMIARLLWGFTIEPGVDEKTGETMKIDPDDYEEGLVSNPRPYSLKITPRSEKHAELIRTEFESVQDYLKEWE